MYIVKGFSHYNEFEIPFKSIPVNYRDTEYNIYKLRGPIFTKYRI